MKVELLPRSTFIKQMLLVQTLRHLHWVDRDPVLAQHLESDYGNHPRIHKPSSVLYYRQNTPTVVHAVRIRPQSFVETQYRISRLMATGCYKKRFNCLCLAYFLTLVMAGHE